MYKKELYSLRQITPETVELPTGFIDIPQNAMHSYFKLRGHQIFINNFFSPTTKHKRLLLYHGTGTGKTLAINSMAQIYINYFRKMKQQPRVIVIAYTKNIIIKDLLKFPELGFITKTEIVELQRLQNSNLEGDKKRLRGLKSTYMQRITNKSKGGYYKFYGYREFFNELFIVKNLTELSIDKFYDDTINTHKEFVDKINNLIEKNIIELNTKLLDDLRYCLITCDEIHYAYNITGKNNGGHAIKFVLDYLEKSDPKSSPRAIYASATPISRSPTEALDLLDLLIPLGNHKREDYFKSIKPIIFTDDALYKLSQNFNGYVSFIKDSDELNIPKRIIMGTEINNIPYLKFTECPMSKYHESVLREYKNHDPTFETLLSTESVTLYDMVFPNNVYNTNKITPDNEIGIDVINKTPVGSFLNIKNIGKYSTKYKYLSEEIIHLLNNKKPGKGIIYHYYVHGSGILLIKNILLENGFIDDTMDPSNSTRCSVCGILRSNHEKITNHQYEPARFMIAHGELSKATLESNYNKFNNVNNINGYKYRFLLGSRVIQEGIDFKAIKYMYILALPKDISTLLQLFGRAIRYLSHIQLPLDERWVKIHIMVSSFRDEKELSPEIINYKKKIKIFKLIQEVEREMQRYAIDSFVNYDKMKIPTKPSLEGLPYTPAIIFNEDRVKPPDYISSYYVHGYANKEINNIILILKQLFIHQPVWIYKDIKNVITDPKFKLNTPYDHESFSDESIKIALNFLISDYNIKLNNIEDVTYNYTIPYILLGGEIRSVIYYEPYYILTATDKFGIPIIDYSQFIRSNNDELITKININKYVKTTITELEYKTFITTFDTKYKTDPYLSLIEVNPTYHYKLMRDIITKKNKGNAALIMKSVYTKMGLLYYYTDFISVDISTIYNIHTKKDPIGYKAGNISYVYNNIEFVDVQTSLFKSIYREENNDIIGYLKFTDSRTDFILRYPLQKIKIFKDRRKINRGAVCDTYTVGERKSIAKKLGLDNIKKDICSDIKYTLFKNEIKDRLNKKGKRWFYLPMDIMPNL